MQVVSRAVVVAIGINALGCREVLGIAVGDSEAEGFWRQFLGSLKSLLKNPATAAKMGQLLT